MDYKHNAHETIVLNYFSRPLSTIIQHILLIVYLFIAVNLMIVFPLIYSIQNHESIPIYFRISILALGLFIIPVSIIAIWAQDRFTFAPVTSPTTTDWRILLFGTALTVFAAAFLYVTLSHHLFFRRIGFEALSNSSLNMSLSELIIHRSFSETATPLCCTALALLISGNMLTKTRLFLVGATLLTLFIYLTFVMINNRFQSALLILSILITIVSLTRFDRNNRMLLIFMIFGFSAITGYSFIITENIRSSIYINNCVNLSVLNPLQSPLSIYEEGKVANGKCSGFRVLQKPSIDQSRIAAAEASTVKSSMSNQLRNEPNDSPEESSMSNQLRNEPNDSPEMAAAPQTNSNELIKDILQKEIDRPWAERLATTSLMVKITKYIEHIGLGWGRFWIKPAMLYVYYFTDRQAYDSMKIELRTTPKVYIAKYYLGIDIADTPSNILTDVYANFGILGLPAAALIVGLALGWIGKALIASTRIGHLAFAFFIMERCLYMEKEFFGLVVDMLKFLPPIALSAAILWSVPVIRKRNST